jgi:exopolyphosphatase/guanosine-5'-triphosphate,3'-diphosphate pyrophosphatase
MKLLASDDSGPAAGVGETMEVVNGASSAAGYPRGRTVASERGSRAAPARAQTRADIYAALDLGTNNCRLLIAEPGSGGMRIVDAFSRIVRLGEGLAHTGRLSEGAIRRTIDALRVCRDKMRARRVSRARLIATEACRQAQNGTEFVARVRAETGLELEVVDRETEARLAVAGCSSLADPQAEGVVVFDIGGGSTEVVWLERVRGVRPPARGWLEMRGWTSLPVGVVTLAERRGGADVTCEGFEAMVREVSGMLSGFDARGTIAARCGAYHLLGTSGTVTTVGGIHLGLPRYDRRRVDGLWMEAARVRQIVDGLILQSFDERASNGCIGPQRADLVLPGCAILEAIRRAFPCERLRIADRGLREGILMGLMAEDGRHPPVRGRP